MTTANSTSAGGGNFTMNKIYADTELSRAFLGIDMGRVVLIILRSHRKALGDKHVKNIIASSR